MFPFVSRVSVLCRQLVYKNVQKKGCSCEFSQSQIHFSRLFRYHMNAPSHQPQEERWGVIYRHPTSWKLNDFLHWTYFHRSRRKCRSSWTERIIQQQACGDDGRDLTARLGRWESVLHSWHSKKPEKLEILRIWVRRWQSCGALK